MNFLFITILLQFLYCIGAFSYTLINVYRINNNQVPLSSTNTGLAYKFIGLLLIIICFGMAGYLCVYIISSSLLISLIIFGPSGLIDSLKAQKCFSQDNGYSSKLSLIFAISIDFFGVISFFGGIIAAVNRVIY